MHRAAKIGLGCLFAPLGLFVLGLVFVGSMKVAGVPETRITDERQSQALPEQARTTLTQLMTDHPDDSIGLQPAVRVILDLDTGVFRVEPGPADEGITVDAEYDEGTFELLREYGVEEGVPTFRLTFRSKVSWLRRLANTGSFSDEDLEMNEVTVFLPEGVPLDLRVKIQRSESELDLSGLALTDLVTKFSMGDYEVVARTDNPVPLRQASFDVGMGETRLTGLSHLRAGRIEFKGGMGEISVDFGTSLLTDTVVDARMRMGELSLRIPDDALLDPQSNCRVVMGEYDDAALTGRRVQDPELAKRLLLNGSVLMGVLAVDEFRSRPFGDLDHQR